MMSSEKPPMGNQDPEFDKLREVVWRLVTKGKKVDLSTLLSPDQQHYREALERVARRARRYRERTRSMAQFPSVKKGPWKPGDRIDGKYEVVERIGQGGMGVVYRARHLAINTDVAVKVLQKGQCSKRFLREARVLAEIRSPHVVAVHDFFVTPSGLPVLIMELVQGRSLQQIMAAGKGRIDEFRALTWMRQTSQGMLAAAKRGIVHRDLKPSNLLIDKNDCVRIVDFGIARGKDDLGRLTGSFNTLGTPLYMAPEQAENPKRADTRSDIYSFGATFYHALTGSPVFEGESAFSILYKHKRETPASPKARNSGLSERTSQLLEKCLAKNPDDRFQDFSAVLRHLEPAAGSSSIWDEAGDASLAECLSRYQRRKADYLAARPGDSLRDVYQFPGDRTLEIVVGSITDQWVDAMVSSDDEQLSMGGGVSAAILRAGGHSIYAEAQRYVPVRSGRAVVTSAGSLPARFVFHGVTMDFSQPDLLFPSRDVITEIIASCLYHAETLNVRSIAFPLLGTGVGGFSKEVCLDTTFRVLATTLLRRPTCVRSMRIVLLGGP